MTERTKPNQFKPPYHFSSNVDSSPYLENNTKSVKIQTNKNFRFLTKKSFFFFIAVSNSSSLMLLLSSVMEFQTFFIIVLDHKIFSRRAKSQISSVHRLRSDEFIRFFYFVVVFWIYRENRYLIYHQLPRGWATIMLSLHSLFFWRWKIHKN